MQNKVILLYQIISVVSGYEDYGWINSTTEISFQSEENINLNSIVLPDEIIKRNLDFPKFSTENYSKTLSTAKSYFLVFDFLHNFLICIQPNEIPPKLIKGILNQDLSTSKIILESVHLEVGLVIVLLVCCILACIIPGTEIWLACRPMTYKPKHPALITFLLYITFLLLGIGILAMIFYNEMADISIRNVADIFESGIKDLEDWNTGATIHLRKSLTRSFDVAGEAIMADLDNVEDLLGKPIQKELSVETNLETTLNQLFHVANSSFELSTRINDLLKTSGVCSQLAGELNLKVDGLRRDLESSIIGCEPRDRPLCATINPSGLALILSIERLLQDERLILLQGITRDNLTESARQTRGEYFYIPHYIARNTLEARNQIRREFHIARGNIMEQTRSLETSYYEGNEQLKCLKDIVKHVVPYIESFEQVRWLIGIGAAGGVCFVWILLLIGLIYRCECTEGNNKVRPILLCSVLVSCIVSIYLWILLIGAIAVSSHTELILCRPLEDPNYKSLTIILESKIFHDKPLDPSLKELFDKCENNQSIFSSKLDKIVDHWKWSGLSKSFQLLKVDLKGLKLLTNALESKLERLLYASTPDLAEHRTMIRGAILSKDIISMSDQIINVAKQINNRDTSRKLERIGSSMRSIMREKIRPLIIIQNKLVDQLTTLEMSLKPFQNQVNNTLIQLKITQRYIDVQGDVFVQLLNKHYTERLTNYLDQWRNYVILEINVGAAGCGPIWKILQNFRIFFRQNILAALNGFWFVMLMCIIVMMASTPIAHTLASFYYIDRKKITAVHTPSRHSSGSPDTIIVDRSTWQTPHPPPLPQENW